MEKVVCKSHGAVCMLKTGVKDGPNKGRSFYVCVDKQGCDFSQAANLSPSHCLQHEDSTVELQALTYSQQQNCHRLFYRCIVGKKAGQKWCGNVPWTAPSKDKRSPLVESQQQQESSVPPVRNPFKAPAKTDSSSGWRRIQSSAETQDLKPKSVERQDLKLKQTETQDLKPKQTETQDLKTKQAETQDLKSKPLETQDLTLKQTETQDMKSKHVGSKQAEVVASEAKENEKQAPCPVSQQRVLPPGMKLKKCVPKEVSPVRQQDQGQSSETSSRQKDQTQSSETSSRQKDQTQSSETSSRQKDQTQSSETSSRQKDQTQSSETSSRQKDQTQSSETSSRQKDQTQSSETSSRQKDQTQSSETSSRQKDQTQSSETSSRQKDQTQSSETSSRQKDQTQSPVKEDQDDEVVLVSVQPPSHKPPPHTAVQKTLTTYPGFHKASSVQPAQNDPRGLKSLLSSQLQQKKATLGAVNLEALPDKGARLKTQVKELEDALDALSLSASSQPDPETAASSTAPVPAKAPVNPFSRPGGTLYLPVPPGATPGAPPGAPPAPHGPHSSGLQLSQGPAHTFGGPSAGPFRGELWAWLLWREEQNPCGGILADDMGLGKTLTMIALILAKKRKEREAAAQDWISKQDSSLLRSCSTLIVCPASLVHHWKKEIERHVKPGKLSVYLYHGPNRERSAKLLADHDVVVTTYGLVSKEVPPPKDKAEDTTSDTAQAVPPRATPLLRVAWERIVLDEAHNIKNPKVQTSIAVCQLRARARWAVTGTPIQNNLLDMYSLLKFLRCAPFDEYKLWKAQVDNGSKRGRERLNLLTRSLLLRRTKDQLDSTGKPLVSLPERSCVVHQLTLSEDEKAVYDVVFAQSRSTLQNYLKRHEEKDLSKTGTSTANPFDRVAQEFGMSQPDSSSASPQSKSSTVHILSLLLRLRQCCCHLSLLRKTLESSELQGDGIVLSLEEQLSALSLSSSPAPAADPDLKPCVSLNGTRFDPQLFEDVRESTKISAIVSELKNIRQRGADHKSVIVSQWTSMLHIVAVHLRRMGLNYAVIDGTVLPKKRMDLVEEFNTNPRGPQVMLVSLCAGGVGLNLIGGNHLFLIDMHWNPALEDQACDRIYRVGQRKDVTIHRFVCEDTVEEKISTLQAQKKELAQNVLSGTGSTLSKLSLADLRIIFGV
ncbi:hypothetical protein WMY93_002086 [Mugilogobius chulae]|uniref:Transcription termination factor 2 n=1 Tax=Mugilogobius chulae TaxID=88201 RepID=A0AAW0PUV3_9GOBI